MKKLLFVLSLLLSFTVSAQKEHTLQVSSQDNIRLPWGLKNLSVVDGRLYGYSGGVVVGAAVAHDMIYALQPDTISHFIEEELDYVVRNPRDSMLYFTQSDVKNGRERVQLYVHTGGRWHKNRQVDIRGWYKSIYHPTFSPDGNMMVFSSQGKVGLGGYDLWCTFWNGKRWSKPINMGSAVNTAGNEVNPVFYHNDLIYASNQSENGSTYHFYTVRLPRGVTSDSIIFGKYRIQQMPRPLNSDSSDYELAVDTAGNCGYWISRRGGRQELYHYQGTLSGVVMRGLILDEAKNAIADADVSLMVGGRVVTTCHTDTTGRYTLLANPLERYQLRVSKQGYFIAELPVSTTYDDSLLVATQERNITIHKLLLNRTMVFDHLYKDDQVELYSQSVEELAPVVDFVRDNPNVQLQMVLSCIQTDDSVYNNILIEYRIKYLRQYLSSVLPSESHILLVNGNQEGKNTTDDAGYNTVFVTLLDKH